MKALVTGVAGFVGSHIATELLAEGHEVVGIDCLTDYYELSIKTANLAGIPRDRFTFHRADLNQVDLPGLVADVDWIFHQAGQPGVRMSWGEDFDIYLRQNVAATQRLLEAATRSPRLKRFVYASSSSVYGDAETYPTAETARPQPLSPYGVTKLAAEHLCSLYAANFDAPTVSLRYFTVYGPGQRTDMAFTRFLRAALLDEEINIFGNGQQIRDFTYVDDIVRANIAAAVEPSPPGSVFNVAGGSNVSVNDTLNIISGLTGRSLRVNYGQQVSGDVLRTGANTDKIESVLGWTPQIQLPEGLARHLAWASEVFAGQRPLVARDNGLLSSPRVSVERQARLSLA